VKTTTPALLLLLSSCNNNEVGGVPDGSVAPPDASHIAPDARAVPDAARAVPDAADPTPDARRGQTADQTFATDEAIADVSVDETGNVWAVGADKLYLMRPGATSFGTTFGTADGIHIEHFPNEDGNSDVTRLTAVAGGGPNQLFLGYHGYESADPFSNTEAQKELGNGDRVEYDPTTNKIAVTRYQFRCVSDHSKCWEDRSVRRIVFAHSGAAAGHSFWGFNHGATHVFNDVLGDHVHPEIIWVAADGTMQTRYGESQALAVEQDGTVWVGNRWGVGLMNWTPDPIAWVKAKFKIAFTTYTTDHDINVAWGYEEDEIGAAVTSDTTVWLASSSHGLSSYTPGQDRSAIKHWSGIPDAIDVQADTDDTLWLVTTDNRLLHFTPATGTLESTGVDDANRAYIDRSVTPRVLWVARQGGVSAFVK
jgi:hypothetical protein